MKNSISNLLQNLIGAIACLLITILTCTGHVQMVIHFSDSLNEMGFAVISFVGFIVLSISVFTKEKTA
ncbi:MAG TPA: hypothetical protein P5509_03280 [Bacteroidales bacterium]|nr:hypothetical protein [Bacteroidales bacterium]